MFIANRQKQIQLLITAYTFFFSLSKKHSGVLFIKKKKLFQYGIEVFLALKFRWWIAMTYSKNAEAALKRKKGWWDPVDAMGLQDFMYQLSSTPPSSNLWAFWTPHPWMWALDTTICIGHRCLHDQIKWIILLCCCLCRSEFVTPPPLPVSP